jgi:hypothetical protein
MALTLSSDKQPKGIDMAIKTKKSTSRKKSATKVRDLAVRKDPRGGAQKREGPDLTAGTTRGRTPSRAGRTKLT